MDAPPDGVPGERPVYNQDLKNPHLVETAVYFQPLQGPILSQPPSTGTVITNVNELRQAASAGNIPTIDITFRIQGVPLILTDQSYLVINLTPVFSTSTFTFRTTSTSVPNYFHVLQANWPKMASCIIKSAKATLSNFGLTSDWPFFFNYINSLSASYGVLKNSHLSKFLTYLAYQRGELPDKSASYFSYFGRDPEVPDVTGQAALAPHNTPHSSYTLSFALGSRLDTPPDNTANPPVPAYTTYRCNWVPTNNLELRIPLREILPVFSVPVIPLLSTNAAQIELNLTLYDPRYMFMISDSIAPNVGFTIYPHGNALPAGSGWIQMMDDVSDNFATMDLLSSAYLNLKVLTDPVQNPLARMYMEPFLQKRDLFRARYLDYYIFQNDVQVAPGSSSYFHFKPSQLFYNMTHIALFFYDGAYLPTAGDDKMLLLQNVGQIVYSLQNARAQALKGHYTLNEQFTITDFQVGLSASNTPLFSTPLVISQMEQMTIDYFTNYGRENMVGDVVQSQMRTAQGDAFYVIDFTHARGAGYFVDSDNMVSITGKLNWIAPQVNTAGGFQQIGSSASSRTLSVIAVIFYTNNLEILLDQGGSVIVSQV